MLRNIIMKKLIILILLLSITYSLNAQWTRLNGPNYISSIAKSGNNIIAGSTYGVYLSTNNGNNWSFTTLNGQLFNSIVTRGNNVFLGGIYGGLFLSTNNGLNWPQTVQNSLSISHLAINSNYLFAGCQLGGGFYRSTNDGLNFTGMLPSGLSPYGLGCKDSFVYTSYIDNVMYNAYVNRSTNNGNSWSEIWYLSGDDVFLSFGFSNTNVFAGCHGGVFCSTDNGSNWFQTSLNPGTIICFANSENNILAGTDHGVYLSTNNGTNWIQKDEGFNGHPGISHLLIKDNYIFASSDSIWRRPLSELIVEINNEQYEIPEKFYLYQNYPNPFNPVTKISFDLPKDSRVKLIIYDILGKEVTKLLNNDFKSAGMYVIEFNSSNFYLSSGIYFYKMIVEDKKESSENFEIVKSMVLIK